MNEKEFNGLILAELVKIANDVFTNEIEIAPGTYTAAELAKLKDANGNEINIKYLCFGSSDRFYFPLVLSGSNKQSITEANNVNRTIRHFFA